PYGTPYGAPGGHGQQACPAPEHVEPALADHGKENCGPRFWISGEYLYWKIKDAPLPFPLLTSGPATSTTPGLLGQPTTTVLFGARYLDLKERLDLVQDSTSNVTVLSVPVLTASMTRSDDFETRNRI